MFNTKDHEHAYKIRLIDEEKGLDVTIPVREDEYIFDAAEQKGIQLPVSCRAGACTSCTGKLLQGKVDQDHTFLKRHEEEAGFVLTCKCYPMSDSTILVDKNQQDALLDL